MAANKRPKRQTCC
ncbi:hypothetical protein LINGRAHAP2_LOCUS16624 [Linum grandiflorum]